MLIFDEVITGFRLSLGGAQEVYGVHPDLTCLGKILGGGLPLAAFGGRRDIMNLIAPVGPVYQAGTLSGNPLAVTAGLATLKQLSRRGTYQTLEKNGKYLAESFAKVLTKYNTTANVNRAGSMMTLFLGLNGSPMPMKPGNLTGKNSLDFFTACWSVASTYHLRLSKR